MTVFNKNFVMNLVNEINEPCISIYLSTEAAREGNFQKSAIKLKNYLAEVKSILMDEWEYKKADVEKLLKPAYQLVDDINFWHHHEKALALFIKPEKFDYVRLNNSMKEELSVSKYFYIIPLLSELLSDSKYYILALSKHSNRFFEANNHSINRLKEHEVDESLDDYLNYKGDSRDIQHHSHKVSSTNTIFHGRGVINQTEEEDLSKYLKSIDKSIRAALKNGEKPLILYCDQALYHYYKKISSYDHIFDSFINGNPENLNQNEIHQRTSEILYNHIKKQKEKIIEEFKELKGISRTKLDIKLIIPDAYYSKVDSLFIDGKRSLEGYFDQNRNKVHMVQKGKESYDLFNYAAILTLRNGGDVYVVKENVPDDINIEALNRY